MKQGGKIAGVVLGLVLLCSVPLAAARPVMSYKGVDMSQYAKLPLPQTVFHSWGQADAEAAKIEEGWKNDPVTVPWTELQLSAFVKHKIMPTRGARGLALMHVAMHDAYELAGQYKVNEKLAVSMAAAQVLSYMFVAEEKAFERVAYQLAARSAGTTPDKLPVEQQRALYIGYAVGHALVAYADTDGAQRGWNGVRLQWYGDERYYGPGTWEPTGPYFYYPPDEPFAPTWRTWALDDASEFRPTPPAYGSPRYVKDLQELLEINAELKPEQLASAKFWVDGYGSVTPPGHWNQIAIGLARKAKLGDKATARLFAQMNIAEADTFIAVWDTKYHYWTARPVTSAKTLLNKEFKPAILTPPFPSYVSGHAAFSGAAAEVLAAYLPQAREEVVRMAEEAAMSRLLGGIHFRHDNEDGLALGRNVARKVLAKFRD